MATKMWAEEPPPQRATVHLFLFELLIWLPSLLYAGLHTKHFAFVLYIAELLFRKPKSALILIGQRYGLDLVYDYIRKQLDFARNGR
jgi:hypothetical protein